MDLSVSHPSYHGRRRLGMKKSDPYMGMGRETYEIPLKSEALFWFNY